MTTPKVSFAAPPPSEADDSSSVRSMEVLDESEPSLNPAARAIFESLAHLFIAPERLTFVDSDPIARHSRFDVYFAKLDETSQTPKDVAVQRLSQSWGRERAVIRLARQLKVWEGLKHANILELLGYYLSPNYDIAQLVSPYLINGGVMEYLKRTSAGIAQRLRFVRDITAGLDYLHNQSPPICHGDLRPDNVTIDENLNAVLSCFELAGPAHNDLDDPSTRTISGIPWGTLRYTCPESLLGDQSKLTVASDIWSWGCTAFQASALNENISLSLK
ncbi:hypothetical protein FS837_011685 [Tulasnella sp. UAMH 9824]|nr:hypothetical protein FS837_011685 [Tulasnella sp. UAMH 9824]